MSYTDKMLRDDALKGKVIVVTGGGSGLGKAMTKYFLELGAQVAITSRDLEKLKNTATELETETGGTCLTTSMRCAPLRRSRKHVARSTESFWKSRCFT